ncbi:MAG: alpha/beta fold hydrolase [Trueperaceae bacterium]|nr:MAG: alpha/beta fold hydrolase [Trueperaceae bacterium]
MRKLLFGTFVVGLVILGVLAQLGSYLLALTSTAAELQATVNHIGPFATSGPHTVGVRRLTVDEAPIPMTVWYPAVVQAIGVPSLTYSYAINMLGPNSSITLATYKGRAEPGATPDMTQGPYPLVVLSHGFAITSSSYAWLAEQLASHGMVVVSPLHREYLDPGVLWRSTVTRPKDILTVLAYVDEEVKSGGELEGLIDVATVAVVGHSYGGYAALAAAGARMDTGAFTAACETAYTSNDPVVFLCDALVPHLNDVAELAGLDSRPTELWPAWTDGRVDAVVSLAGDAVMFGGPGLAELVVPVMAIGGTADTDSPFMWGTGLTYNHASSSRRAEVALEDAAHLIFAGECDNVRRIMTLASLGFCSDPAWDRDRAHDVVKYYVTAFLRSELKRDHQAAAVLALDDHRFPKVRYRAVGY